jgi:hypothetical protein
VLQNAAGGTVRVVSASVTINTGSAGANGLDTGAIAASKWYAVYLIYNAASSTIAGMISLAYPAPTTLPSGYTYYTRLGWVATDAGVLLLRTKQIGREVQYIVTATASTTSTGGNTPSPILIASATAGTFSTTSPVLVAATVQGNGFAIPNTAASVTVIACNDWKGGTNGSLLVAPNVNYGGTNNGPAGSNGNFFPVWMPGGISYVAAQTTKLNVESSSIAWCSTNTGCAISCLGWSDNL